MLILFSYRKKSSVFEVFLGIRAVLCAEGVEPRHFIYFHYCISMSINKLILSSLSSKCSNVELKSPIVSSRRASMFVSIACLLKDS